jgi:hypothetical protein
VRPSTWKTGFIHASGLDQRDCRQWRDAFLNRCFFSKKSMFFRFNHRSPWVAGACLTLSACQTSPRLQPDLPQPVPATLNSQTPATPEQKCISTLDLQLAQEIDFLKRSARNDKKAPAAHRSGLIAFAFPRSKEESKRLNHMALFAAQVFVRPDSEGQLSLPMTGVLHSQTAPHGKPTADSKLIRLPEIFPISRVLKVGVQDTTTQEVNAFLGTHTQIVYGFVPLVLLFKTGVIGARLKSETQVLELFKTGPKRLSEPTLPEWLKKLKKPDQHLKVDPEKLPDPKLTIALLNERFCLGRGR